MVGEKSKDDAILSFASNLRRICSLYEVIHVKNSDKRVPRSVDEFKAQAEILFYARVLEDVVKNDSNVGKDLYEEISEESMVRVDSVAEFFVENYLNSSEGLASLYDGFSVYFDVLFVAWKEDKDLSNLSVLFKDVGGVPKSVKEFKNVFYEYWKMLGELPGYSETSPEYFKTLVV